MSSHQPNPNINVNLTIDGIPITVPEGTTILEAAKKVNINIPVLCEHPKLCKRALCRICVVEFDGRPKLITACGNDVWEGVSIVTKNERLFYVRKTILEMILANHPQNCLSCVRSKSCELQILASQFGITSSSFTNEPDDIPAVIESETLVRDMSKCVKCNRCVEVCQEMQKIGAINTSRRGHEYEICTAFNQPLEDVKCVFCGGCASVCPVGAIYGHDQTQEVWKALGDSGIKTAAQVSKEILPFLEREFGSVTAGKLLSIGKLVAAIKLLGFDKVYDASISANVINAEIENEVQARGKSGAKLPVISGYAEGVIRFINNFYPNLAENLTSAKTLRQQFAALIKADTSITTVSFVSGIAQKYSAAPAKTDFALTAVELARMIKTAGIVIEALPEEQFDKFDSDVSKTLDCKQPVGTFKKETVHGYAQAREVMESIQKGECDAQWVEILDLILKADIDF